MKNLLTRLWRRVKPSDAKPLPAGAVPPGFPDWRALLEQNGGLAGAPSTGKRILIATSLPGFQQATTLETLLGAALAQRGADVHFLLCDEVLSACLNLKWWSVPDPTAVLDGSWQDAAGTCRRCRDGRVSFQGLGLPIHNYGDLLTTDARAEADRLAGSVPAGDIPAFRRNGVAVGEHAHAGCLRYFSRGNVENEPHADGVLRKYFHAALVTQSVIERLLDKHTFDAAVFHHGIYIPQGIIGEVCRARGVRVVNWNPAYRKQCFIFSHGDTYHHTLLEEPVSAWKDMAFTDEQDREIQGYLKSRWSGSQDWIWFHGTPDAKDETLVKETGIDLSKPVIGLLTNVVWDAQLHYRANAFPSMLDWLFKTIEYFKGRPDLQLLIRVHPAEIRGTQPSRQPVMEEIRKRFPDLPANVFLIKPESDVNTYTAMANCNSVIIYGTKTGVELTSMGVPVIVAGEAWIRNKGLTIDASSEKDYYRILDGLPLKESRLSPEKVRESRKYAYHFFLRRMIPFSSVAPKAGSKNPFELNASSLKDISSGRDRGLDLVCEGILTGSPFVYAAERETVGA